MPVPRITTALILLGCLVAPGQASLGADRSPRACLTRAEQRDAIAERKAIPLAAAIKLLRERGRRGEVVRADLCKRDDKLVYELTLLGRNGKVARVEIDAGNGEPISGL
ncbi:PepSY domain-containing protein [Undibacter mobilis]|uniref:PepSY domain-containing protein n=1 Tax=Undibacter mobilis TaxID=2292256 RepID=A0A371B3U6_9BRAD|nr:PepSY domain-containing protein [Undibacter mobilis]RDV02131.1 hypothetical protein DXH78_16170 [Undibacter mobilis]